MPARQARLARMFTALAVASLLAAAACLQLHARHARLVVGGGPLPRDVAEGDPAAVGGGLRVALLQRSARLGEGAAQRGPGASALAASQAPGGPAGAPPATAPVGAVAPAGPSGDEARWPQQLLVELGVGNVASATSGTSSTAPLLMQVLFAILYYYFIVRSYPKFPEGHPIPREVANFQQQAVCEVLCQWDRWENVFLSCCCGALRAAHTMEVTGIMDFWLGCMLMTICPCCVLGMVHCSSDLKDKLGTAPRSFFMEFLCSLFCAPCVIAQDAIALDMIVGARTSIFSVETVQRAEQTTP